jgi:CRISPR-associated endonuclease/helicase Cas3
VTQLSILSKARAYLRLYSADLVLDEVDNYSPLELPYLQRLCFLAGLARKNVICMSATLSPILSMALLREYRAGLRANQLLTGLPADTRLIQVSNTGEPACLEMPAALVERPAAEAIRMFNNESMAYQAELPSKVKARVLDATVTQFGRLKEELFRLHADNHGLVEGVRVSVGFARFSQVQSTQSFARYLMETNMPADTEMALIFVKMEVKTGHA